MTPTFAYEIDNKGDLNTTLTRSGNSMTILSDKQKTAQDLKIILKSIKGSYPLNPEFGVDYKLIMRTGYKVPIIRSCFIKALSIHPDIKDIVSVNIEPPTRERKLHVSITVKTKANDTITLSSEVPS